MTTALPYYLQLDVTLMWQACVFVVGPGLIMVGAIRLKDLFVSLASAE